MTLSVRALAVASFFVALGIVGLFAYPALAEDNGLDFWNVGEYQAQKKSEDDLRPILDRKDDIVMSRLERREEIIQDLTQGRISFEEATEQFAMLNRDSDYRSTVMVNVYPGRTDEERAAWQLVTYLRSTGGEVGRAIGTERECILLSQSAEAKATGTSAASE